MNDQQPDPDGRRDMSWRLGPAAPLPPSRPSAGEILIEELDRIDVRLCQVLASGREAFVEGSASYDHAIVAVIRLAALFEKEQERFGDLLAGVTQLERNGVTQTRNIAAHHGYAAMDDERFWRTVTVYVPALIAKIRDANGF